MNIAIAYVIKLLSLIKLVKRQRPSVMTENKTKQKNPIYVFPLSNLSALDFAIQFEIQSSMIELHQNIKPMLTSFCHLQPINKYPSFLISNDVLIQGMR